MENQFTPSCSRRNFEECNISEAALVQIDYRFQLLETDIANLKALNLTNQEMLRQTHEKIMQSKKLFRNSENYRKCSNYAVMVE